MATERIEIIVTEKGTREVERRITSVGDTAQRAGNGISFLQKALAALGGALILRQLVQMADTFTLIQNRLGTVTTGVAQLTAVTEDLFRIANETRQNFQATAEVYSRTALAVKELGISQAQTLKFTRSLNQAVILSGASAQEAQAGLIQLSQGLASGALRGDELRSVLEQLPAVADVIAKGLGVTRGELRKLGEEGQITADIILDAFEKSAESLNEKFAKTIPTIGQSFEVLRNSAIKFIGELNKSTGASELLSKALLGLAANIEVAARSLGALAIVLGVQFAQVAIGRAIAGLQALRVALLANPVTALLVVITSAIALLISFSDKIRLAAGEATTLADLGVAAFQVLQSAVARFITFFESAFGPLILLVQDFFGEFDFSLKDFLRLAAFVVDRYVGIWVGGYKAIQTIFRRFPDFVKEVFVTALNGALTAVQEGVNSMIRTINNLPGIELPSLDVTDLKLESTKVGNEIGSSFMEGFNQSFAQEGLESLFDRADQVARDRISRAAQGQSELDAGRAGLQDVAPRTAPGLGDNQLREIIESLERENQLLQFNSIERERQAALFKIEDQIKRELTATEREYVSALLVANQEAAIRADLLEQIRGPQELIATQQRELNRLFQEGAINVNQYQQAMAQLNIASLQFGTTAADGFRRGFEQIKADILDVSGAAENVLTNAFSSAEDALVDFVKTGKVNFSSFVDGILADLTKLLARQALGSLLGAFGGGGGAGGGGIINGILGAFGGARAEGGPVNPNQSFLVGENGPEMFTPPGRGNIVPNEGLRMPAMQPPQVNVQVVNIQDPAEIPAAMDSRAGDQVILNALARNPEVVKQRLNIA